MSPRFTGCITEIVTPFRNGCFDEPSFRALIDRQIAGGINGLSVVSAIGERHALSREEQSLVTKTCIEAVGGRVPVLAATGSNSTAQAIELACDAGRLGADAIVVATPYYNKPTQEGLFQHLRAVHDAARMPMIIDNSPFRSAIDLSLDTFKRVCDLEFIVGIKESSDDVSRILLRRHSGGRDILHLCGQDWLTVAFMANGGHGSFSVVGNIAPATSVRIATACLQGDFAAARHAQDLLVPLMSAIFCDQTSAAAKFALSTLFNMPAEVRLPTAPLLQEDQKRVKAAALAALKRIPAGRPF
jgi:4-hydroxy-tetrahydrodipicolinate synthase